MYVCMYLCMYVCIYVCIYVCMYVNINVCMNAIYCMAYHVSIYGYTSIYEWTYVQCTLYIVHCNNI